MSSQGYYNQQPQYPPPSHGNYGPPPPGPPPQSYPPQGYPPPQMQYQQPPPQPPPQISLHCSAASSAKRAVNVVLNALSVARAARCGRRT
ncbi:hypothetical protein Egran_00029 [Elaphomyces granulatus]|uniref:Uncharacterized protein n=1 Tax=Elaphomyces granulatus TaxID=519963 RepID=A0A232M724_9EURO|nr:hypothetical protein Egran_00029 [Elaphomyces granulatus]